jgi:hypothetical protein
VGFGSIAWLYGASARIRFSVDVVGDDGWVLHMMYQPGAWSCCHSESGSLACACSP